MSCMDYRQIKNYCQADINSQEAGEGKSIFSSLNFITLS